MNDGDIQVAQHRFAQIHFGCDLGRILSVTLSAFHIDVVNFIEIFRNKIDFNSTFATRDAFMHEQQQQQQNNVCVCLYDFLIGRAFGLFSLTHSLSLTHTMYTK